jgi:DTW domain-containing protein YfiP
MDLTRYRQQREQHKSQQRPIRNKCYTCFQPDFSCYCAKVRAFDPGITFVILIHPIEAARRVATGRMSHLALKGSYLIRGEDFSQSRDVLNLLADQENDCKILYPGTQSTDLTKLSPPERGLVFAPKRRPVIFVIDGTWGTARKMVRLSLPLQTLPRIQFTPPTPSRFRVRMQPNVNAYSTIEAIHHTLELLAPIQQTARPYDHLLELFDAMVEQQILFAKTRLGRRGG